MKGPLSILLVNDDGWDAPGITAAYDALTAAGHEVTMVAPAANQSGRSMASGVESLTVTQPDPGQPKYAVDGTPVDSLNVGLFGVLANDRPDLVVSGINLGANVAANTNYSGTVGAASAAAEAGVPAVAVSADTDTDGRADFADASRTVVELVDSLAADGFDGLGRAGFLNVNVPAETATRKAPRGIRVARLAAGGPRTVRYEQSGPTTWTPQFTYDPRVGSPSADAEELADGWTTVTWLTASRVFPNSRRKQVDRLVDQLEE
ncbi:5'/3'-nucleotidase SurE [Aeromicrobium wangtongii]|uniref:5'/3'-nucleotidase SurE n=1 Tax=Aeromicrobium wangtongii TaxID=2969247 RepID=UPI0020170B90|nr:5'/3'-nucleotidase SurE [Aeromicrobium wangtongii]MCL3817729.1 5'/3'-nucleotidase SurE [Aeromicrobium wangtongii]